MSVDLPALDAHLSLAERDLLGDCRRLADDVLAPIAAAAEPGRVDGVLLRALAEHGLLDRLYARDGDDWRPDVSAIDLCLIREGLARGCTEAETAFAVQGLGSFPLLQSGTPSARTRWIPGLAAGEYAAGFALSEPQAGSDVAQLALRAERDGSGYRLTGEKTWISNAPDAGVYTVFARTTDGAGARGLTAFVVPADSPGLSGERLDMVSPHPIGRLVLDGVPVAADQVLGEVDRGFAGAQIRLGPARMTHVMRWLGAARRAHDVAVSHAARREGFGSRIGDLGLTQKMIADNVIDIAATRALLMEACRELDEGGRASNSTSIAKTFGAEAVGRIVDRSIQICGGLGVSSDLPLARLAAEVRPFRIYDGPSEVHRWAIAKRAVAAAT